MSHELIKHSKQLSYVLRHRPDSIGISLGEQGWVEIDVLLDALRVAGRYMDRATLDKVVAENNKKRFAISEDGKRIRASQGHSVEIELGYTPVKPPTMLYHGTIEKFIPTIMQDGLIKGRRHHVHLSADLDTATNVGGRRGEPVILVVQSSLMHSQGHEFYQSENGVWLTDHVPAKYLSRK